MALDPLIIFALTVLVCGFCQWLAWRVRLPAIIFLLFAGMVAGPVSGLLHPEELLGDIFYPFVSLSVAIILFEGSITLKFKEIIGLQSVVRNLLSFGLLITWGVTTLAARFGAGLSWEISSLFAAITVVTGPTVIAPMLRTVRPSPAVANVLRWEGIVIDPIGATFAVLIYEFVIAGFGDHSTGSALATFGITLAISGIIGVVAGYLFGLVLRNRWLPEFLHNIAVLGVVFTIFVASNMILPDSGLVSVTVMGILLANMKDVDLDDILEFKEHLSILLVSLLFVMLTAALDINAIKELGWSVVVVFLAVQFVARPLNAMASTVGSKLSMPERHLLAWIAPKGIVAAAISTLFSIQLINQGFEGAEMLVPLTFSVIIGTVFIQSITARPIAKALGVAEPDPDGFLIIGANIVAREIASALHETGVKVLLVDTGWGKISKAKTEGLPTYYGNPVSDPSNRYMDLVGIGKMLALAQHNSINLASAMHYGVEFGKDNIYSLSTKNGEKISAAGNRLFSDDVTFSFLFNLIAKGAKIHTTQITDVFGYEDYKKKQGMQGTSLFAVDLKGKIYPFHSNQKWEPKSGWSIIYLSHQIGTPDKYSSQDKSL